ncbi:TIM-barrel domain-containing protein [Dactylosporangium sp. NPDC049140]|uniref:TIM-barrel domain-containing protein n=1 Tax=Dactylosporangium sp. NPDC049140 TaxID=3155647 RepID=UPI003400788E
MYYAAAYGSVLRSCGKAPVTFSRAGFTGSQAHGVFWAGDEDSTWEAMWSSLRAGEVEVPAPVEEILVWCRLETAHRRRDLFTFG